MRNEISYEWVFEPMDEHGDIIDPVFADKLSDLDTSIAHPETVETDVALKRIVGNNEDGILNVGYAYVNSNGNLPSFFDCGHTVPQQYKNQLINLNKQVKRNV